MATTELNLSSGDRVKVYLDGRVVAESVKAETVAAAPELYAALAALDPYLDHIPGGIGAEIDDARAALAKAEGR
jgi:hypothetical protein